MSLHKKIFWSAAVSIVGISLLYIGMTHLTVKYSIEAGIRETRGPEIAALTQQLTAFFLENNDSWDHIQQLELLENIRQENPEILIMDRDQTVILKRGASPDPLVRYLGIKSDLHIKNEKIGQFYYYDPEIANFNKIMIGIPISVVLLLAASGSLLIILSLIVAYGISKWLAAPLRDMLPVIERLGKGALGIQVPVKTKDEYGRIAAAFNQMSRELEQGEIARRNLTADVAHELRTPLTIISGKLDDLQLRGTWIKPESLLPLQDELIRLNRLVEDLRILSLAEAGKLTLNPTPTNLSALVQELTAALDPIAEEQQISMTVDVLTDDTTLPVDRERMRQVFLNLLTNAIRYTHDQGSITIRLLKEVPSELKIVVEDTGIGIEPEHLPYLFNRFYRADAARTRYSGGSGLGLAIAKQYVLAHGGRIEVESIPHQGTRFMIHLPSRQGKV